MELGVHLPQIGWDGERFSFDRLTAVTTAADRLGYGTITANDHLVYRQPWLDGPTALAAMAAAQAARERVAAMVRRSVDEVATRLPIGSAIACLDLFGRYEAAGLQRLLIWPIADEVEQLERVATDVMPHLART